LNGESGVRERRSWCKRRSFDSHDLNIFDPDEVRNLAKVSLLTRELFPEVAPRVEYELTELGASLLATMRALVDWVGHNWTGVKAGRAAFDERQKKPS
jgi:hypothetical protein